MAAVDIIVFTCLLGGALFAVVVAAWRQGTVPAPTTNPEKPVVFLFKNGRLRDMTAGVQPQFPTGAPIDDLAECLSGVFPDLSLDSAGPKGIDLTGSDGSCRLTTRQDGDVLVVEVTGLHLIAAARTAQSSALVDDIYAHAPQLVWQQDAAGRILWSNAAFRRTLAEVRPAEGQLFPTLEPTDPPSAQRLQPLGCDTRWFDITAVPQTGDGLTCFATETTDLVRADENRREYVKTLGRTFGDLATGLAIFDKDRQLKMFNPALLEMTKLPFAFLSARPRIDMFFDRMRELQMTPEPKDYIGWREQFLEVEAGAKKGTYCENWPLPDGQTYRVTGRPHPDGAFALLFEDITAEISLTRRFRSEIETGQAVLDSLPDAVAVFTHSGTLVMTNLAYGRLWGSEAHHFAHRDLGTELAHWRDHSVTSPIWSEVQRIALERRERKPWAGDTLLLDGRPIRCFATPLDGGMTLVRFAATPLVRPVVQKLLQRDPAIRARSR